MYKIGLLPARLIGERRSDGRGDYLSQRTLQLNFSVNAQGEPVYELFYKGKPVINPSKLGLELKNDPGLMNGFMLADAKTSTFGRDLGTGMG